MITRTPFGKTRDGVAVDLLTLTNSSGMEVDLITYGATVNAIRVPDRGGAFADVLIGFDSVAGHEQYSDYQGNTVGRYANRIAGGAFTLDGVTYKLEKNERGITCLHGGAELSRAVWKALIIDDNAVEMQYSSPDGSMGFPGNAEFRVTFLLHEDQSLEIKYDAVSDKKTVFNMTNHAYFNLSGGGNILGHVLTVNADAYTPTDADSIPTGELRPVAGTPFDFRAPKPIGQEIGAQDPQLIQCRGYDHNFCLNDGDGPAAVLQDPVSGRMLQVYTDLPGMQVYTGNFLDGTRPGKGGIPIEKHAGVCLETQCYPNTPNMPAFPSCVYDAGVHYRSRTVFKFSVQSA